MVLARIRVHDLQLIPLCAHQEHVQGETQAGACFDQNQRLVRRKFPLNTQRSWRR